MMHYYVTRKQPKQNHAGSKAVADTDEIMFQLGYKEIAIYGYRNNNPIIRKIKNYFSLYKFYQIQKESIVVVEHPLYISNTYLKILKTVKKRNQIKLVFLIHDFETIRSLFPDDKMMRLVEKELLECADCLIVHNEKMKKAINKGFQFPDDKIISLGIFDYLCNEFRSKKRYISSNHIKVAIAGNLNKNKSGYIYKIANELKNIDFDLYGVNFEGKETENFHYCGSINSDDMPNVLTENYGLVWDGTSIEKCDGATGNYLQINDPHKFSLYVAAELPIIIWKKAALADFVEREHIGITINSLKELENKLNEISDDEYNEFCSNLKQLSLKVRSGEFLKKALNKMDSLLIKK